jgi:L-threonylcarbamoyladenylate synthase
MEEPVAGYLEGRNIDAVAVRLLGGGVAVLPTDTIYGFHCVYSNVSSLGRIMRLKGRSKSEGLILLASSITMADRLVSRWPAGTRDILASLWPAPVTAILPASMMVPAQLQPGGGVAVRIPDMVSLRELIERTGEPLVSTSVNRSGDPPLNMIGEIKDTFFGLDAYISRRGPGGRKPSTLIDLAGGEARIVRWGKCARHVVSAFGIE